MSHENVLATERLVIEPFTREFAQAVVNGTRFDDWAEGFLTSSACGAGLATEAVNALCTVSERLGTRVWAGTESGNIASERVLVRCGFTRSSRTDRFSTWRR